MASSLPCTSWSQPKRRVKKPAMAKTAYQADDAPLECCRHKTPQPIVTRVRALCAASHRTALCLRILATRISMATVLWAPSGMMMSA